MRGCWSALFLCLALLGCQDRSDADQAVSTGPAEADSARAAAGGTTAPAGTGALLDPDQATSQELLALPGIDSTLADTLVAGRPYPDMLAVDAVLAGRLSEAQRDSVYARLWKPIDPNTASDREILLIPGVGDRMLHEFREYRPWRSLEHFRREIGKYVDADELARLERYVKFESPQ